MGLDTTVWLICLNSSYWLLAISVSIASAPDDRTA